VDLNTHRGINQYDQDIVDAFGWNTCGLAAAASDSVTVADLAEDTGWDDYNWDYGIQPTPYTAGLSNAYGSENVHAEDSASLGDIYDSLDQGNTVIVDIRIGYDENLGYQPSPDGDIAHFARVLGVDWNAGEVYIESTLPGDPYWTMSFDEFNSAWTYPETSVPKPAPGAEAVNRWMVSIH
jgi:hypothetical protein